MKKMETPVPEEVPVVKPIEPVKKGVPHMKMLSMKMVIGIYVVLILLGVGVGYLLSRMTTGSQSVNSVSTAPASVDSGKIVGSTDSATFKDTAIGVLQKGGTDGEGTHQLIRTGGPSQTVTLLSSVIDLDQYVGKKVKVYGQTLAAQKAAWLMDVGRVELQ